MCFTFQSTTDHQEQETPLQQQEVSVEAGRLPQRQDRLCRYTMSEDKPPTLTLLFPVTNKRFF